MPDRKLLLITGVPATGKTTIGDFLQDKLGFKHIDFEDGVSLQRFAADPANYINTELGSGEHCDYLGICSRRRTNWFS